MRQAPTGQERIYSTGLLTPLLDALAERRFEAREALRGTRLWREIVGPDSTMSADEMLKVFANITALASDPDFAFKLGLRHHLTSYGMYGFAILSCTNFGRAIDLILAYGKALDTPAKVRMVRGKDEKTVQIIFEPLADVQHRPELYRFIVELRLGQMITACRDILGEDFSPTRLTLTYARSPDKRDHFDLPGCSVAYGADENMFIFDAALLDRQLEYGNPVTHAQLTKLCDEMLVELDRVIGLSGRVRALLATDLGRKTSIETVSASLGMSPRTLRRKLEDEGTSFSRIADELRLKLALKYLRDTGLKVDSIAAALGFADAASFRRSLKRWDGRTPKEIRAGRKKA
ncbi:AraC family transcriptional regulator [Paracoccus sulfuroxidans]|uniref:AraC-like DNA-binding protein n=1 Tax=Paracoccus sulfuroxidans TaxID=384678 RepID=A0A562NUT1_9RHOB|nr:AraC family transcriptional regulator [Paracoccus sulfuroxidans]TWI35987.1 AraC-like DNA-binding protein [Paracoccus sulfuroxidans]